MNTGNAILDNITAKRLLGEHEQLSELYSGKVLLVVNTASKCGFTPQYQALETVYQTYKDQGFIILGFPSTNFAHQEFDDETQIQQFCDMQFSVTFPMFASVDVIGANTHPLFRNVRRASNTLPKWNFYKYLINRAGTAVKAFSSLTKPQSPKITQTIEAWLSET
jgi:glutathione peroxidase